MTESRAVSGADVWGRIVATLQGREVGSWAKEVGVASSTLYRWRDGVRPRWAGLVEVARALKVSPSWLAFGESASEDTGDVIWLDDPHRPSTFADRLRDLVDRFETVEHLATEADVPFARLRRMVDTGKPGRVEDLERLARLDGRGLDWLVSGRTLQPMGERPAGGAGGLTRYEGATDTRVQNATQSALIRPSIDLDPDWLGRLGIAEMDARCLETMTIEDDAMAPLFALGDLVLVDRSVADLEEDGVYALDILGRSTTRRLQRRVSGEILVRPDNPAYEVDQVGRAEDLTIRGRVRAVVRPV